MPFLPFDRYSDIQTYFRRQSDLIRPFPFRGVCSSKQKKNYNLSKKLVRSADLGAFQQSIHETAGLRFKMLVQVDHPSPARAEADPSQRYQGLEKCISQEFVVGMLTGPAGPEFRFLIVGIIQS